MECNYMKEMCRDFISINYISISVIRNAWDQKCFRFQKQLHLCFCICMYVSNVKGSVEGKGGKERNPQVRTRLTMNSGSYTLEMWAESILAPCFLVCLGFDSSLPPKVRCGICYCGFIALFRKFWIQGISDFETEECSI